VNTRREQVVIVLVSVGVYVVATVLPAITVTASGPTTSWAMTGFDCLANGPFLLLKINEGLSVIALLAWLANVPYLVALIGLASGRRRPRAVIASTLLALLPVILLLTRAPIGSPFGGPFVGPGPSGPTTITSLGVGYVAWLAALFVPSYSAFKSARERAPELGR
jgi:hypothetical protein